MRASQLLGFVAAAFMPLTVAAPASRGNHYDLEQRGVRMSAAQFNFAPVNLTNIGMECARGRPTDMYDCQLRFDWHDPNSVKENKINSCTCITKWQWDGHSETHDPSQKDEDDDQYTVCLRDLPMFFEFRIRNFNTTEDFELEIAHHYTDSENFTWPYNHPTTFAVPVLHLPIIQQSENRVRLYDDGPVYVNITGVAG